MVVVFKLTSYLPDAFLPQYEAWKDNLLEWLERLGIIPEETTGATCKRSSITVLPVWLTECLLVPAESSRAQQNLASAIGELNRMKGEKAEAESTITKIFHPEHFGLEGEWKKLDDECLEYDFAE